MFHPLTPPLPQPCKISGLKSVHIHACRQYIFDGLITNLLSVLSISTELFSRVCVVLMQRVEQILNDLKFGTFVGRFQNDEVASIAVKGLTSHTEAR